MYTGMVGTAVVTAAPAGDAPSGVDYTEYRVKTGATQGDWVKGHHRRREPVRVGGHGLGRGLHTVEYRSVDKAGNAEAAKSVAFGIDIPVDRHADGDPDAATATATPVTPKPTPTATPAPPAPKPTPSFMLAKLSKTTVARFAKNGLAFGSPAPPR